MTIWSRLRTLVGFKALAVAFSTGRGPASDRQEFFRVDGVTVRFFAAKPLVSCLRMGQRYQVT